MNEIACTEGDELYMLYLTYEGIKDALIFLCQNDTPPGFVSLNLCLINVYLVFCYHSWC